MLEVLRSPTVRTEAARFAALAGLCGVAFTQPLLDVFGNSPETFLAWNTTGRWIWAFAGVVAVLPAAVLWAATLLGGRRRTGLVDIVVGVAGGLAGLVIVGRLGWGSALAACGGVVAATGTWWLHRKTEKGRQWLRLLALLPFVAVAQFLFGSQAGALRTGVSVEVVDVERVPVSAPGDDTVAEPQPLPSVLWIMLDELPTRSIVTADGAIDPVRFPNLAAFAGEATWYRNATTLAGWTRAAVPSLLTGRNPTNDSPVATSHPNNIFRILAGSHHLTVSESLTDLCACGPAAQAPPAPPTATNDRVEFPEVPASETEIAPADDPVSFGSLLGDTVDAWRSIVSGNGAQDTFGDFTEDVVAITTTTTTTPQTATSTTQLTELPAATLAPDTQDERQDLAQVVAQPERFRDFLAALTPSDEPTFAFFHLVLPHHPWQFWPDGTSYPEAAQESTIATVRFDSEWDATLNHQRHLLQATYADALLGQALDRARELPGYEDMMVIVSSDHGIAFGEDRLARVLDERTAAEIMWTPLLIRAPGQTTAGVDDSNVLMTDVVPTVLDMLGLVPPWEFDGAAIGSDAQRSRGEEKPYFQFSSFVVPHPDSKLSFTTSELAPLVFDEPFGAIEPGEDPVAALARTVPEGPALGDPFEPTGSSEQAFQLDPLDPTSALVTGSVPDATPPDQIVVVGVDDRVVAVSPLFPRDGGLGFAALLPQGDVGASLRFGLLGDTLIEASS